MRRCEADLAAGASAPGTATAGTAMDVDASVQNNGPDPAENTVMTMTLPAEVTFSAATGSGSHDGSPTGGVVTWTMGTLAVSGSPTTYTVTVNIDGATTGDITHTVNVSSDTDDPGPSANVICTSLCARSISVSASPSPMRKRSSPECPCS